MALAAADVLGLAQKPVLDENQITSYEYYVYSPFSPASLGYSDEITIAINFHDLLTDTANSFVYVEGKITKADGVTKGESELVCNGVAHLFEEVRFKMASQEISKTRNTGIVSTLKNYLLLNPLESHFMQMSGWENPHTSLTKDGKFTAFIPLKSLLGLAEDLNSPIINAKQELTLLRSRSDVDCLKGAAGNTDKIVLSKIAWHVPHITLSDSMRLKLMKIIDADQPLQIAFRDFSIFEHPLTENKKDSWTILTTTALKRPKFVIVALQTGRRNDVTKDASVFDHCSITDMRCFLNAQCYPYAALNSDFTHNQYLQQYLNYCRMKGSFAGTNIFEPLLSYSDFKSKAPIFVFDTTKSADNLIDSTVDCRIEYSSSEAIPKDTIAYALIIHDRLCEYRPLSNSLKTLV
ncbi:unnamed protein product [Bemisia tabaci]|uniref:Double jelly roll-like domain-containing protein n=1 Tax=Bemisia tabaci TaxID=7038 RepID=A0A9P0F1I6_BEMTA|nr:unnamed protein product [Bemisia tabaci]